MENHGREFILKQMELMAEGRFDKEAFGESETFAGIVLNHECMLRYPDEGSPEALIEHQHEFSLPKRRGMNCFWD